jgi:hypothetical protein
MTTPEAQAARVKRLQNWVIGLVFIIVLAGSIGPLAIISYFNRQADATQVELTCQSLKNQDTQLQALRSFAEQIGVPWVYPIPEVPPECDGS